MLFQSCSGYGLELVIASLHLCRRYEDVLLAWYEQCELHMLAASSHIDINER